MSAERKRENTQLLIGFNQNYSRAECKQTFHFVPCIHETPDVMNKVPFLLWNIFKLNSFKIKKKKNTENF